jgi:hypothetical protein
MKTTRAPLFWAALTATFCLTACTSSDASVGFALPHLSDVAALDVTASPVEGVVHVTERGCFTLDLVAPADQAADGLWIFWPDDTVQDDKTVHLPDDVSFTEGSHVSGDGMVITLNDLPDGADENTKIGSFGRFCEADASGVIVLQRITGA